MKRLFFICPTDCMEVVINNAFDGDNYFVSSLGNSLSLDASQLEEISALIETEGIKEVHFVLSYDNRVLHDAFGEQQFSGIGELNRFYHEIANQSMHSVLLWQTNSRRKAALLSHLNTKAKELHSKLNSWLSDTIRFGTKVYDRDSGCFCEVPNNSMDRRIRLN